jgi:hypothetical protein
LLLLHGALFQFFLALFSFLFLSFFFSFFFFFFFFLLFLFLSSFSSHKLFEECNIICQPNHQIQIISKSSADSHKLWGDNRWLHMGMALALFKCQESSFSCHPEPICLVIFIGLILRKVLKNSDQQLRAFSSGFNKLTVVLHSEKASKY